jgi:hypothetical protein
MPTIAERDKQLADLYRECDFLAEILINTNDDVLAATVKRMLRVAYDRGTRA